MINEVTVFIRGGAVQEIAMPEGTVVTVVDWDIEEGDEEDMSIFDGERAYVSEWHQPKEEEQEEVDEHGPDCECGQCTGEDRALEAMEKGICECERMFEPDWDYEGGL